jgi:hypothetical protein
MFKRKGYILEEGTKEPFLPKTRGSVGWACVAHLSFCFEET